MTSDKIVREYSAFKLLNMVTKELTEHPYIKGSRSRTCEDNAIREQMRLTGQPRSEFVVHGLIKRQK